MEKIKIITDSTSDLPSFVYEKRDIEVLPLLIYLGEQSYLDGVDMKLHTLLMRIQEEKIFPRTGQVNPQRFYDCFKKYLEQGYKVFCMTLSSKMSGTYQSACIARDMLETDDIVVVDSRNVTSGLGLLVLKAADLRDKGLSLKEIEKEIKIAIPHVKSALAFETLEYLVKGGRLSKTAGIIGNVLGIKPILAVADGEMKVIDKVRGSKKAIRYIMDYLNEVKPKSDELAILLQVENKDILSSLRVELVKRDMEVLDCSVGCTVGTHAGPGACGVFYIEEY